jgi:hypothetical protein
MLLQALAPYLLRSLLQMTTKGGSPMRTPWLRPERSWAWVENWYTLILPYTPDMTGIQGETYMRFLALADERLMPANGITL